MAPLRQLDDDAASADFLNELQEELGRGVEVDAPVFDSVEGAVSPLDEDKSGEPDAA